MYRLEKQFTTLNPKYIVEHNNQIRNHFHDTFNFLELNQIKSESDLQNSEIDFNTVKNKLIKVDSFSKFQNSKKDLSIIAPKNMQYSKIKNVIKNTSDENIKQFNLVDIYSDEKLGSNESLTIRFVIQKDDKTMEEEDITSTMSNILETLNSELGIGLRE